jgi:hypothetical protein
MTTQQITCPICHSPIEIPLHAPGTPVACPLCGRHFLSPMQSLVVRPRTAGDDLLSFLESSEMAELSTSRQNYIPTTRATDTLPESGLGIASFVLGLIDVAFIALTIRILIAGDGGLGSKLLAAGPLAFGTLLSVIGGSLGVAAVLLPNRSKKLAGIWYWTRDQRDSSDSRAAVVVWSIFGKGFSWWRLR